MQVCEEPPWQQLATATHAAQQPPQDSGMTSLHIEAWEQAIHKNELQLLQLHIAATLQQPCQYHLESSMCAVLSCAVLCCAVCVGLCYVVLVTLSCVPAAICRNQLCHRYYLIWMRFCILLYVCISSPARSSTRCSDC